MSQLVGLHTQFSIQTPNNNLYRSLASVISYTVCPKRTRDSIHKTSMYPYTKVVGADAQKELKIVGLGTQNTYLSSKNERRIKSITYDHKLYKITSTANLMMLFFLEGKA